MMRIIRLEQIDFIGKFEIYDNCVIEVDSTILCNTKIGPNAMAIAGIVVLRDVPSLLLTRNLA